MLQGINLSGGQKHRLALARALYAAADVNLLDDPLSAVDAHVGQHLFEQAIRSFLGASTCVLVTHQQQCLPAADVILIMNEVSEPCSDPKKLPGIFVQAVSLDYLMCILYKSLQNVLVISDIMW